MIELTFAVGENRTRATTRRLTPASVFNDIMKKIKVHREFSRRARALDFSVLKAQEMRNICIFFFPVIIQCIEPEAKERRLWFLLTFMLRSCVLPEGEFANVSKDSIEHAQKQFYLLFEKLFSAKNCTYSVHVLASHLLQKMRAKGPLTETSAFVFESFYGEMRNAFAPGTCSTVKQIMEQVYLKRTLSYHSCEKTIYFSPKDTALENNSIIYVHDNNQYNMYKIINIPKEDPDKFQCNIQGRIAIDFPEANELDWGSIGVFKEGATGSEIVEIDRNTIHGKVMKVCSLLITCPKNILREN